jgi:Leucine-rich repeat (LRR) protein
MEDLTLKDICLDSGEFAVESVFTLGLRGKRKRLTNLLSGCVNVGKMDLAENKLETLAIDGNTLLGPFPKLKFLDLGQNRLRSLASLPMCENLKVLHLEGNRIKSFEELAHLKKKTPKLRHLFFKAVNNSGISNPICEIKGYAPKVLELLPELEVLDGMRVKFEYSLFKLEQSLQDEILPPKKEQKKTPVEVGSKKLEIELPTVEWLDKELADEASKLEEILQECDGLCKQGDKLIG